VDVHKIYNIAYIYRVKCTQQV